MCKKLCWIVSIICCIIGILIYSLNAATQKTPAFPHITIEKLMSTQEFKDCGLQKLSETELDKLSKWVFSNFKYAPSLAAGPKAGEKVSVIAPSVSTSMKAREIRLEMRWLEVPPKQSDYVLVVVRSELYNPLMPSYDSFGKLKEDAEMQLNISGSNYHIYIYWLHDTLEVSQLKHISMKANNY